MATVLVTGVGGVGGTSTVRWLAEHTAFDLIGVDMNPRARGFLDLDRCETVPPAADPAWADAMADLVTRYDVDCVIPLVDAELARLGPLRETLPSTVRIVAPTERAIERTLDKRRFADWLATTDLLAPATWCPDDDTDLTSIPVEYPAVVKPRHGHGSTGVERVDSPAGLRAYFDLFTYEPGDVVVQQFVDGAEFTASVVATRDNDVLAIVPKRVVESDGNTTWGVTHNNTGVAETCRRLHDALSPRGPLNVQLIVDDRGNPLVIEANPRFSSTACLTARAGVDELSLLVKDALGESVTPTEFTADVHLIRAVSDRFVSGNHLSGQSHPDER